MRNPFKSFSIKKNPPSLLNTEPKLNNTFLPVLTGNELLSTDQHQALLCEMKQQLSVTHEDYAQWYLPLIQNTAELMQQLPLDSTAIKEAERSQKPMKTLLTASLTHAVNALKIRRGYMLPVGADTETCNQQQSSWTYAILIAALLQESWRIMACYDIPIFDKQGNPLGSWNPLLVPTLPFGYVYQSHFKPGAHSLNLQPREANVLIAKSVVPQSGFQWLCENPVLLVNLLACLSKRSIANNPVSEILEKAQGTALHPPIQTEVKETKTETAQPIHPNEPCST